MDTVTTGQALAAARHWLKPAVHVLLRCGVPWKEFSELAKSVYVDVATERFGKRGRPTNVSRTAVLTGMTRRDVRKQRARLAASGPTPPGYVSKASLILSAWHHDVDFLDKKGKPRVLPAEGEGASFATLVRRCGGADVQPTTLLKELVAAGCVRRQADGRLKVLLRDYIPYNINSEMLRLWGTSLADLAATSAHNLTRGPKEPARFEREAVSDRVPVVAVKEFRAFLEQEGQAFLERIDAWLTEHRAATATGTGTEPDAQVTRLGAGVYHLQD
jgi:hypothetical protein